MKKNIKIALNKVYDFLEDILFLAAFIIFNAAMFKIGIICGLITLSITLFFMASLVTFAKSKK